MSSRSYITRASRHERIGAYFLRAEVCDTTTDPPNRTSKVEIHPVVHKEVKPTYDEWWSAGGEFIATLRLKYGDDVGGFRLVDEAIDAEIDKEK